VEGTSGEEGEGKDVGKCGKGLSVKHCHGGSAEFDGMLRVSLSRVRRA
jgi:hypothetical protein